MSRRARPGTADPGGAVRPGRSADAPETASAAAASATAVAAAALAALADVEGSILVVCDFDGTLAAIDPDPQGAVLTRRRGVLFATWAASPVPARSGSPWPSSPGVPPSTSPVGFASAA